MLFEKCLIKEYLQVNQVGIPDHQVLLVLPVHMEDPHLATLVLQDNPLTMVHQGLARDHKWCLYLREGQPQALLGHLEGPRDLLDPHSTSNLSQ